MDFFRAKLVTIIIAYGCIIGGLIGALLHFVFPAYYPHWFEGMILYFLVTEGLAIYFVEVSSRKATQKQLLNTYLLIKVAKMLIALVFVGIYALVVKDGIKNFVLVFMSFYLLFLAMETYLFMQVEKRLKNKVIE